MTVAHAAPVTHAPPAPAGIPEADPGGSGHDGASILLAVEQRLQQVAAVLFGRTVEPVSRDDAGTVAARVLPELVQHCRSAERMAERWLLLTAVYGSFPDAAEVQAFSRRLELAATHHAEHDLLRGALAAPGRIDMPMTIVEGAVVAEVDYCARHETHTGIHRVVRETVPRWHAEHEVHPVAWLDEHPGFRTLTATEGARVLGRSAPPATMDGVVDETGAPHLVVPWRSVVVLADVLNPEANDRLAALARFSGNSVGVIGYDMIPITSAETRPASDIVTFAQYLTVVKHSHRLAAISRSAATEFSGFVDAVRAQGLAGPRVVPVPLPSEPPAETPAQERAPHPRPVVVCPGSQEPHKNHRAVLHAAERLWREGLDFEVRLVGGPGWRDDILRPAAERLVAAGRPLALLGRVSDERLADELASADLAVFVSLHEGYGLPIVEALGCGTPVLTADFGSQREIAEQGGCVIVDPRDDDALTAALRRLVTSPELRERLRGEIEARPVRTWDAYAADLWSFLVDGRDGDR